MSKQVQTTGDNRVRGRTAKATLCHRLTRDRSPLQQRSSGRCVYRVEVGRFDRLLCWCAAPGCDRAPILAAQISNACTAHLPRSNRHSHARVGLKWHGLWVGFGSLWGPRLSWEPLDRRHWTFHSSPPRIFWRFIRVFTRPIQSPCHIQPASAWL